MYYVRFWKAPKLVQHASGQSSVQFVLTIVTDLGETFYPYDITLHASVNHATKEAILAGCEIRWKGGMRALPVIVPLVAPCCRIPFKVDVSSKDKVMADYHMSNGEIVMPIIFPVVSAPVLVNSGILEAPKLALRNVPLLNGQYVSIWEDSGNSIAHHIWDAGVALTAFLDRTDIRKLVGCCAETKIRVIELGTGCGLVGLALTKITPNCDAILTDVDEAEEFITLHNIPPNSTNISYYNLDWKEPLPNALTQRHFDLILVADCIYNPDSSPNLVNTIDTLEKISPGAKLVLATKPRHPSEAIFFNLMKDIKFDIEDVSTVLAPSDPGDASLQNGEKIHIYLYTRCPT